MRGFYYSIATAIPVTERLTFGFLQKLNQQTGRDPPLASTKNEILRNAKLPKVAQTARMMMSKKPLQHDLYKCGCHANATENGASVKGVGRVLIPILGFLIFRVEKGLDVEGGHALEVFDTQTGLLRSLRHADEEGQQIGPNRLAAINPFV
jgi:hypothetical protein